MKKIILITAILTTIFYGLFIHETSSEKRQNEINENCQNWTNDGQSFYDCQQGGFAYKELKKLNSK